MSKFETWLLFFIISGFLAVAGSVILLKRQLYEQFHSRPRSMSTYEKLSLLVAFLGFAAVTVSIFLLYNQTRAQVDSLRSISYIAVNQKQLDLDNIFIQNPELRPYFFERKGLDRGDKKYDQVLAIADYTLDYFDLFFTQADYFLTSENDPEDIALNAWRTYITESFERSPILCQRLYDARNWYTEDFIKFAGQQCPLPKVPVSTSFPGK